MRACSVDILMAREDCNCQLKVIVPDDRPASVRDHVLVIANWRLLVTMFSDGWGQQQTRQTKKTMPESQFDQNSI